MINTTEEKLKIWFSKAPNWQKHTLNHLLTNPELSSTALQSIYSLCKSEYNIITGPLTPLHTYPDFNKTNSILYDTPLILETLSNISGVGAISAQNALTFNPSFNIIYGENGSGKSSYTRLLKSMCQVKTSKPLLGNVFSSTENTAHADCKILLNGEEKEINWSITNNNPDLNMIQIYDTDCANIYLTTDNEVVFEPLILAILTNITEICSTIQDKLSSELNLLISKLLPVPDAIKYSPLVAKYEHITIKTNITSLKENFKWNDSLESELNTLSKSLSIENPSELIDKYTRCINALNEHKTSLITLSTSFNEQFANTYLETNHTYLTKKNISETAATQVFSNSNLEGIGTDIWKSLWQKAREFSEKYAYTNIPFPSTSENAICVLCHQPLSEHAKQRLCSFENFVKSALETDTINAKKAFDELTQNMPDIPDDNYINLSLKANGIDTIDIITTITSFYQKLRDRKNSILNLSSPENLTHNLTFEEINTFFDSCIQTLQNKVELYKQASIDFNAQKEMETNLKAQHWLSQHLDMIDTKLLILKYQNALKSANTRTISVLKSELSELIITQDYITHFQQELQKLGASHIKVDLIKSKTSKGKIYHKIILKNAVQNINISNVLSEGEFRIVSIAAFLAELDTTMLNKPFIFDDPISSLDLTYEEAVVKRLVNLSTHRQVIVFTHRIAFAQMLCEECEKNGQKPYLQSLRKNPIGEPEERFPLLYQPLDKACNEITNNIIPKLQKRLVSHDYEAYEQGIAALCSDIRKIIENGIESSLLNDIVKRFRRSVSSQKLRYLSIITPDDINLFDSLMTKYSYCEHSQPSEAIISPFTLEEINHDITQVKLWFTEFKQRQKQVK